MVYLLYSEHAFLGLRVSDDVKHVQAIPTNNRVVHLRISADVGIHSSDGADWFSHSSELWNAELIYI